MRRIPEPEIMGEDAEAKVYELADFSEVNQAFAERVVELVPRPYSVLMDLGCGLGDILVRILRLTRTSIMPRGLDGSKTMLNLARERIKIEALENSIHLIPGTAQRSLTYWEGTTQINFKVSLKAFLNWCSSSGGTKIT